jgi:hypothetical protein
MTSATPGLGLPAEDGDARLVLRGTDVHQKPPFEPGAEARVQAIDLVRWTIAGKDHLLLGPRQAIEGAQQHLLGLGLTREELDIVHEEDLQPVVTIPNPIPPPEGFRQLGQESLEGLVGHGLLRVILAYLIRDGTEDMGLSEP